MPVKLEDLLENLTAGFLDVDSDLRILYMNQAAETLLRKDRSIAVGRVLQEVIPDAVRSQHWSALVQLIKERQNKTISVFYPEQYRWHDVTVIPTRNGGAGLLVQDVTDRQWLIRREAERAYLQNVFEDAPFALSIIRGPKLTIEYTNAFARQLIGNRRVIGLTVREALPELEQRELFDVIERVYRDGTRFNARDVLARWDRNNDGLLEEGYFDVSYLPIRDFDASISGVLSISIEVTERVQLIKSRSGAVGKSKRTAARE